MSSVLRCLYLASLPAILLLPASLSAVDFLRGDANEDGRVSIADVRAHANYLFKESSPAPDCEEALDVDNDGQNDATDTIAIVRFLALDGVPPEAPYPVAGPDPSGGGLGCTAYGGGSALEDPAARLIVRDSFAPGGASRRAYITIALSHSVSVFGYTGKIVDEAGIIENDTNGERDYRGVVIEFTGRGDGGGQFVNGRGSEITFYFGTSFVNSGHLPPKQDYDVLQIPVCLKAGTPAGEYSLTLQTGELAEFESGRAIAPLLVSGTLTVSNAVGGSGCDITPGADSNVVFKLDDALGYRGETVSVPFSLRTNRGSQAIMYSINFDENALEVVGVEESWQRPDGAPSKLHHFEAFNEGNGFFEGSLGGIYQVSHPSEGVVFPTDEMFQVLGLRLRVREDAPFGSTEIGFLAGAHHECRPEPGGCSVCTTDRSHCYGVDEAYNNFLRSGTNYVTPDTADSFVFVSGIFHIVGDLSFFRGDTNGDRKVDISDAIATLHHLFLGAPAPLCDDAADSNDDGQIDLSDAVNVLDHLFTAGSGLPAPAFPQCGGDPTDDALACGGHSCD